MPESHPELPPGYPFRPHAEITPAELRRRLGSGAFRVLDVREQHELGAISLEGAEHVPLGTLIQLWEDYDLEDEGEFALICAHGIRSLQAALFLQQVGISGARSVAGGFELWSQLEPG